MLEQMRAEGSTDPFSINRGLLYMQWNDEGPHTEATLKVYVDDREVHVAGDGVGPIDALNNALRKGVAALFPGIQEVNLYDYHVDLIKEADNMSPSGVVQSTAKFHCRGEHWVSVAEHTNQDYAGWMAIVDAYILAVMLHPQST